MDAHDKVYRDARDKLAEAIREYDRTVSPDSRVIIASTVVYEASTFDDEHDQIFSLQHLVLDGSLSTAVGMMDAGKIRLISYINSPDENPYHRGED